MDDAEWEGIERPERCKELLGLGKPGEKEPLPFSFAIAQEIYEGLFGEVKDLIKDKHLLIVPSGPLTSLPFQVLVTEKPKVEIGKAFEDYRDVARLARRNAITVLPSVASLKALRTFAKKSPASDDYVGFGDPVLKGDANCRVPAGNLDSCPEDVRPVQVADASPAPRRSRGGRRSVDMERIYRNGAGQQAVLAEVASLCRLLDTAQEIRCVAKKFRVPDSEIHLGERATEADIKALSESGKLQTYKVIHFATHGLLAGDVEKMVKRRGEPALYSASIWMRGARQSG